MRKLLTTGIALSVLTAATVMQAPAQEGLGERIDRGVSRLRSELREEWATIRQSVERLGVQGRVFSRLRWDKELQRSQIDIDVQNREVVVLRGTVSSATAKQKAVQLARDTVGVEEVVDELQVSQP